MAETSRRRPVGRSIRESVTLALKVRVAQACNLSAREAEGGPRFLGYPGLNEIVLQKQKQKTKLT